MRVEEEGYINLCPCDIQGVNANTSMYISILLKPCVKKNVYCPILDIGVNGGDNRNVQLGDSI